jgi:hypothetical protein
MDCNDATTGRAVFAHALNAGTTYYVVIWDNSPDSIPGETSVQLRVSPATRPSVVTLPASSVTSTGVTLHGMVNANGLQTRFWFEWGPTSGLGSTSQVKNIFNNSTTTFTTNLPVASFLPDTPYHFRMVATNILGMTRAQEEYTFVWSSTRPMLVSPSRTISGNFRFQFMGNPGQLYAIQGSITLSPTSWVDLGLATNLASTLFQFTHVGTGATPYRFYRARLP